MNIFDEINLPPASKYLVSLIIKKEGSLDPIEGTNAYLSKLSGKEYIFLGDYTPLTPYMYGIVFSNQKYWSETLKDLKMKHVWKIRKNQKKILFLMTQDGFYNAVLEKEVVLIGDGKRNIKTLIKNENMRRINAKEKLVMPISIKNGSAKLNFVPRAGEEVIIPGNYDYEDVTQKMNVRIIKKVREIIDFLPRLPFIVTEIYISGPDLTGNFVFGRVSISPGVNIFFQVTDGKKEKETGRLLLTLL